MNWFSDCSLSLRFSSFLTADNSVDMRSLGGNMDGKYLFVFLVAASKVRQYLPSFCYENSATFQCYENEIASCLCSGLYSF